MIVGWMAGSLIRFNIDATSPVPLLANPEDVDDDTDAKTRGIQFKVGFLFSLGG